MAAPSFVAVGTHLAGTAATASVNPPAGTAAGRVVIVTLYLDGAPLAITPASGFAIAEGLPVGIASGGGTHALYKWWKRCTGTDSSPYVFTWTGSRYHEVEVTLWDDVIASGDPWDPGANADVITTNSPTTPPVAVTTAGPDRTLIWSGSNWSGGTWTAPSGFTERFESTFGLATEASSVFATAGATGPIVGTCTSSDKTAAWLGALIGTTGGGGGVAAVGRSAVALSSQAVVRKVAAVTAITSLAVRGTAVARKAAPASGRATAAAVSTGNARKAAPVVGRTALAAMSQASARKRVPAVGVTSLASGSSATAAKRAPATGVSAAAVWSYRSQVISRPVTAVCSVVAFGRAAARKLAPGSGRTAAAVLSAASARHVATVTASSHVAATGTAQARHVAVVTGRGALAAATQASARKVAAAGGRSYAAVITSWAVQQPAPTRGSLAAGFPAGPGMTAGVQQGSRITTAERHGAGMGAA